MRKYFDHKEHDIFSAILPEIKLARNVSKGSSFLDEYLCNQTFNKKLSDVYYVLVNLDSYLDYQKFSLIGQ